MKTISQIQQEVLATAQVTLDELQASIEKFWEQGWERNEEAKRTCQSSKWYANNISRVIRNKEIQASGVLSIHFYCESREKFYAKRDQEVRLTIEQATAKLKLQVEKKLTPIKDKIQSFDLISFRGQQGNYVGEWVIRTEDARYIFKTSCILAGGYNIQCLHARYIANLKQVKK